MRFDRDMRIKVGAYWLFPTSLRREMEHATAESWHRGGCLIHTPVRATVTVEFITGDSENLSISGDERLVEVILEKLNK